MRLDAPVARFRPLPRDTSVQVGRRRVSKDVNGDGEPDDVFYLDKATLRRNDDLRLGRHRLVVTGVIAQRISRPGRKSAAGFWPPVRSLVEFNVVS